MSVNVFKAGESKMEGEFFDGDKVSNILVVYGAVGLRARGQDKQETGPTFTGDRLMPAGDYVLVFPPHAPQGTLHLLRLLMPLL
jgi:hypothetical protein